MKPPVPNYRIYFSPKENALAGPWIPCQYTETHIIVAYQVAKLRPGEYPTPTLSAMTNFWKTITLEL